MNAYFSALVGLLGVAIGSLTSFATTWITQRSAAADRLRELDMSKREKLYQEFILESSRLFADALTHQKDDVPEIISIYAMVAQMRLTASAEVVQAAEQVMRRITDAYDQPNLSFTEIKAMAIEGKMDFLHEFSESCRADLVTGTRRSGLSIFSRSS